MEQWIHGTGFQMDGLMNGWMEGIIDGWKEG